VNNEEKILSILEQMQGEIFGFKQWQAKVDQRQTKLEQDISEMRDSLEVVRCSTLRAELEEYPRIETCLDGLLSALNRDDLHEKRLQGLEKKVDRHDADIFALKASQSAS